MARKKPIDEQAAESAQRPFTDSLVRAFAANARAAFGQSGVFVGMEADALLIGVPMFGGHDEKAHLYPNCLPMEYLLSQSSYPLGLIMQLVGRTAIGKSALLAEMGRWFFLARGGMVLLENETKFNARWYDSILGPKFFSETAVLRCQSVEDWQQKLSWAINEHKRIMEGTKTNPGPGRTYPVLFGVDSVMGKSSEEVQEKIFGKRLVSGLRGSGGEGAAGRGFAVEALLITRYLRTLPQELDFWPFATVLVNHVKYRKSDIGTDERHKPGGEHLNFQESFEIEVAPYGGNKRWIESANWSGKILSLKCEKNSFGPTGRHVLTRMLYWFEDRENGQWRQHTVFDWDWATVKLLSSLLAPESPWPRDRAALKQADIHVACPRSSDVENLAWSRTLGMRESDAVSWQELGAMIRTNPEVVERIRNALRITPRPVLQGDYVQQIRSLASQLP